MDSFMPTPFRGIPGVPHAPEELFRTWFIGSQLALGLLLMPGRILGSDLRPRRFNRDHLIAACDEAARTREVQRGKQPRTFVMRPSSENEPNFQKKWWKQLHRRRWMQGRMGGGSVRLV